MKNKYRKKIIGKKKDFKDKDSKSKNSLNQWLKSASYLDTKEQNALKYLYVSPRKKEENEIFSDGGSEIDNVDLKKSNIATKIAAKNIIKKYRNMARKTPYKVLNIVLEEPSNAEDIDRVDTIETLDDTATLQPGKKAQLAAKKISEKYNKMREAKNRKNKFKLLGEIVKIQTIETPQGEVNVPVSIPKSNVSSVKTAKNN